jgi:hypothetical protein
MSEEDEKKEEAAPKQHPECNHPLVCPLDWEEPPTRKVISEYHKSGTPDLSGTKVDEDLEAFEEYWKKKGAINFATEYHKPGSPYMEVPSEWDGHRARLGETPTDNVEQKERIRQEHDSVVTRGGEPELVRSSPAKPAGNGVPVAAQRDINVHTIEIISYALLRGLIGAGVRIPLKRENIVDAELSIKGREIVFDTRQLYFNVPELVVWRIIYTHKGKPILEFGRGVKNGMQVHRWNTLMLGLEVWRGGRKNRKEMAKLRAIHDKEQRVAEEAG